MPAEAVIEAVTLVNGIDIAGRVVQVSAEVDIESDPADEQFVAEQQAAFPGAFVHALPVQNFPGIAVIHPFRTEAEAAHAPNAPTCHDHCADLPA